MTTKLPELVKIWRLYPDLLLESTLFPPVTDIGAGAPGGPAAPPKEKPPTPLEIPVRTGFSFLKNSLKIEI